ncbi:MAG: esterase/lipase family protein [Desulfatiglandales bacterium]
MFPIVMVHGICPFDRVYMTIFSKFSGSDRFSYFKGIRSFLTEKGYSVFTPTISWGGPIEKRAKDLFERIMKITGGFKRHGGLHLIGHSMGGLDIRFMVYKYDLKGKVKSITTIGTPHLGSPLADIKLRDRLWVIRALKSIGVDLRGFLDLTTQKARNLSRLLEAYEKSSKIPLRTIAGRQPHKNIFFFLKPSYRVIASIEGENDGLVSVDSAMYKRELLYEIWDLDHLNQIGWWDPSEDLPRETFYEKVRGLYLKMIKDLPT